MLIGILLVLVIISISVLTGGSHSFIQPIDFNHYKHFVELDIECTFCHQTAEEYDVAGLPNIDVCNFCHEEGVVSENRRFQEVVEIIRDHARLGTRIEWNRIYQTPDDVIFSHRIHVARDVDCKKCHGITGTSKRPSGQPELITMDNCINCHEENNISTDCLTCHK